MFGHDCQGAVAGGEADFGRLAGGMTGERGRYCLLVAKRKGCSLALLC